MTASAQTLEDLELKLLSEDLDERTEAAKSLCASRDRRVVRLLLVCLEDEDLKAQSQAVSLALGRLVTADHTGLLAAKLKEARKDLAAEGGWRARKALVHLLGRTGSPEAAPALLPELDSPEAGIVSEALAALGAVGNRNVIPAIRGKSERLPELDVHLSLARLGEADSLSWLLERWEIQLQKIGQLKGDAQYARRVASYQAANGRIARLVLALPPAQTPALVTGILGSEAGPVLEAALAHVERVTTREDCRLALPLLNHRAFHVRKRTLALVRRLGDPDVIRALRQQGGQLMAEGRPAERVKGVWMLGMMAEDPAPVLQAMADADAGVQKAAIEIVGERKLASARPVLEGLSDASNWDVRLAARMALLQLGGSWPLDGAGTAFEREVRQLLEGTRQGEDARRSRIRKRLRGNVSKFDFLQGYPIHEKPETVEPFLRALKASGCTAYDLLPVGYVWNQYHFDLLRKLCRTGRGLGLDIWATLVPPSESPELASMPPARRRLYFLTVVEEFGAIAREFPNFIAYTCDDFAYDHRFFSPRMLAEMSCLTRRSAPDLAFLPLCYWWGLTQAFFDNYDRVLDGVVFHFRCESSPDKYIPDFDPASFDDYAACMRHELGVVRKRFGDKPVVCGIYIWYTRGGWGVNYKKDGRTQPDGSQTNEHAVRDATLKARVAHELSDGLRIYGLGIRHEAYRAMGQELSDRREAGLHWGYLRPMARLARGGRTPGGPARAAQTFLDGHDWPATTRSFVRGQLYDYYFLSPQQALQGFLHFHAGGQRAPGLTKESGHEIGRLFSSLLRAAPPSRSLRGAGLLAARDFAWLPEGDSKAVAALKRTVDAGRAEIAIAPEKAGQLRGWLALDVEQMSDPFTVVGPDGSKQPTHTFGHILIFHVSEPGTWRATGLPSRGQLAIPGHFACKWFRVKFSDELRTRLVYELLPDSKSLQFECEDLEVDARGELAVQVGQEAGAFVVTEDGEAFNDFERHGRYLLIRGVRPNVTYRIGKVGPTPALDGL